MRKGMVAANLTHCPSTIRPESQVLISTTLLNRNAPEVLRRDDLAEVELIERLTHSDKSAQ